MKIRYSARSVRNPGRVYRGADTNVPSAKAPADITVPEGTEDSVECVECGARVMALVSGRPRGHAAGGLATNTRAGRYKCEGSGNEGNG